MEDDTVEVLVSVSTLGLDSDEEDETWTVKIPNRGLRAMDGAGIDQYTGSDSKTRTFQTEGAGADDKLQVSLDSSNPDSSIIKVDEDDETEDVVVLVFELDAEGNDIEIEEIPVLFTIGTANFEDVVSDVKLEIDGEEFNDYTTTGATTTMATTTFEIDSGDEPVVPEDGSIEVKVIVDLQAQSGNYIEGETIQAQLRSDIEVALIKAEGGDDLVAADISGSAIGDAHQLLTEGIFAEIVSTDEEVQVKTIGGTEQDEATFELVFDVTAFDDTFYISATSAAATVFGYRVEDGSGADVATSTHAAVSSTATKEGDSYRVNSGDTETFTLTVTLNPDVSGFYRVELDTIKYGTSAAAPGGATHNAQPDEDFETDNVNVNA
jgi:hypothetical protein